MISEYLSGATALSARRMLFLFSLLLCSCNSHLAVSVKDTTPSPKVYNFHDVVQHISKTSYRVTDIDYDDNVNIAHKKPINKKSEVVRNHYAKLAHTVDELNLVNYQCDTIQIYDFWSEWSVGDVYNSPLHRLVSVVLGVKNDTHILSVVLLTVGVKISTRDYGVYQ